MSRFQVVCLTSPDTSVTDIDIEQSILEPVGADVTRVVAGTEEATIVATRDADAILHRGGKLTASAIQQLRRCRIIAHGGVGYDSLDLGAATAKGIIVTNVADYCVDEVSDHALLFMLALSKRLLPQLQQTRAGKWAPQGVGPIHRLCDSTVAVVGYGRIGSTFGRKARQLGLRVLAVDPYLDPADLISQSAIPRTLDAALPEADFVSLHVPLSNATHHLFGRAQFRQMKSSAYMINTARGGVVDEGALIDAVTSEWIAGAALDVLEQEPPDPHHPLLHMSNVLVTPHAAYYSEGSVRAVRRTVALQVKDVLRGTRPKFVVNPDVTVKNDA